MSSNNQEIESKFYVRDLPAVEARLTALGAVLKVPRGFEYNLRFDDPKGRLSAGHRVLRLRKSDDARITYKGPGRAQAGAVIRTELEIVVDDFEQARALLEALGYHAVVIYEKYRSMYELEGALVTLDELPYGNFVEIEVARVESIAPLAQKLALDPNAAIPDSYLGLFERVRAAKKLSARNLAFAEFAGQALTPADLGVRPAD